MTCEYCGTEHPPQQIANPHYCIARLGEQLEREEERSLKAFEKYEERIEEKDKRIKGLETQIGELKRENSQFRKYYNAVEGALV